MYRTSWYAYVVDEQDKKTRGFCPANYRVIHNHKKKISAMNQSKQMTRSPRVFLYPVHSVYSVYSFYIRYIEPSLAKKLDDNMVKPGSNRTPYFFY